MENPQEIDGYIKETIDYSLGLPISVEKLEMKLRVSEDRQKRLRDWCNGLISSLKEKDKTIQLTQAESAMNARALKKFVEENQRLQAECTRLEDRCRELERECLLYHEDREALMDFGNEADEKAQQAEARVHDLEEVLEKITEEMQAYKDHYEDRGGNSAEATIGEEDFLNSILSRMIGTDDIASGQAFLQTNDKDSSCRMLLERWNSLQPTTQKVLSMIAGMKKLEKDKELIYLNLNRAEAELALVCKHNQTLDLENRMLLRQRKRERSPHSPIGKLIESESTKSSKQKLSPRHISPVQIKMNLSNSDSARQPLSPLKQNCPESKINNSTGDKDEP